MKTVLLAALVLLAGCTGAAKAPPPVTVTVTPSPPVLPALVGFTADDAKGALTVRFAGVDADWSRLAVCGWPGMGVGDDANTLVNPRRPAWVPLPSCGAGNESLAVSSRPSRVTAGDSLVFCDDGAARLQVHVLDVAAKAPVAVAMWMQLPSC